MTRSLRIAAVCSLAVVASCSSPRQGLPRIAELYRDAASRHTRNPVVVIHGVLGARLTQRSTGKTVWGAFTSDGVDPNTPEGARAIGLSLEPPVSAADYDPAREDVYAVGPLDALQLGLLFSVVSVEVYANLIRTLGAGGYTDNVVVDPLSPAYSEDHFTCFTFFYDWRRDNVENAIRFGRFLTETRVQIDRTARRRIEKLRASDAPAELAEANELEVWLERGYRFDIVAHSMGGLIARYYLRYGEQDLPADGSAPEVTWAGAQEIDRLIMVGTPNFGAMDALQTMVHGYQAAFFLPHFHPTLLGTMPALYQLLPRNRHGLFRDESSQVAELDLFDASVWETNQWGLFDPSGSRYLEWIAPGLEPGARREHAREYLGWCLKRARRFHDALDGAASAPCRSQLYLFASDTEETITRCTLRESDGILSPEFSNDSLFDPGDGTVPRFSAVGDDRVGGELSSWLRSPISWTNVTFLADDHIGLTANPYFSDNVLFLLLETPPPGG